MSGIVDGDSINDVNDNIKPDQGLKMDHGTVYGLVIKYIKPIGLVEKFFNFENASW